MKLDSKTLDKIETYVNGFMRSPELELFELELMLSYDLQMEVNFFRLIHKLKKIQRKEDQKIKNSANTFLLIWTKIQFPINYN